MTPLLAWLQLRLPPLPARACLVLIYAALLVLIVMLLGRVQQPILYLDAGGR